MLANVLKNKRFNPKCSWQIYALIHSNTNRIVTDQHQEDPEENHHQKS